MNEILDRIELSVPQKSNESTSNMHSINSAESFGCCSRYRACSDARSCLIPEREYSKNCIYRKKLESGTIFYGKNANLFSAAVYAEFVQRVNALSPQARTIFNDLLIYMREYYRAVFSCVVRNCFIEELSSVGLFTFRPLTAYEFPPRKADGSPTGWKYDAIASSILSDPKYGSRFEKACAEQKAKREPYQEQLKAARDRKDRQAEEKLTSILKDELPGEKTKDFLVHWLSEKENKGMLDRLSEPYRMAILSYENLRYAEELYHDTLLTSYDNRIHTRSVWWEDGMLSPAEMKSEEERRIKLSHGYSDEEKVNLLNAL